MSGARGLMDAHQVEHLRAIAVRAPMPRHSFDVASWVGYMSHAFVCIMARLDWRDVMLWGEASTTERRMFLLLVAYDIETFWDAA